jgi:hypothetical protein
VALDHLQQVRLDVRSDNAIGFDDGAGLGVGVVPAPANLRANPAAQGAEHVGETLAGRVWALDALERGPQLNGLVRAPMILAAAGIPAGPLDDNFVHVSSHSIGKPV